LHVRTAFSIPGAPSQPAGGACFDKYTLLKMKDGSMKSMISINPGDILQGNNTVTSKMTLDSKGQEMFNIGGTIVSGSHKILHKGRWLSVSKHPERKIIPYYEAPLIYCLNTSLKRIQIGEQTYMDWDELYDEDIENIKHEISREPLDSMALHTFFDSGFSGETKITMNDLSIKNIKDIQVGDVLDNNILVFGIVTVNGGTLNKQYQYNLGKGAIFKGGPNLNVGDKNLERMRMQVLENREDKLYHLITKEKYFYVGGIKFFHYDSNIELLLDRYSENYYL